MLRAEGGAANVAAAQAIDGGGADAVAVSVVDGGPAGFPRYTPPVGKGTRALQGDPRLIMGQNGTYLQFVGGQPLMDGGLENLVLISLFTNEGWCGNGFMKSAIGSKFVQACDQPVTRQSLNDIRNAAEKALVNRAFGRVTVTVENPTGYRIRVNIFIEPPAGNPQQLTLTKNGTNWQMQASSPAYPQVRQDRWAMQTT